MQSMLLKKVLYYSTSFSFVCLILIGCNTTGTDNAVDDLSNQGKAVDSENMNEDDQEGYVPSETDIIFKENTLTNVELLDQFVEVAGEKGNDNESKIRIVKYVSQGVMIYDLQSRYDDTVGHRWIEVLPDMSYYQSYEGETQDVFNNAPQQCNYMEKHTTSEHPDDEYYKLFECRTHWEYRILPVVGEGEE
ncbi:hypothetical protein [Evansella cellulosilytica]|uniref:DUF4362 domain-containing protein n=1 Tax=Evansella cellulosilytica (strain ATCC 21833 / DSM 2522 / FERM P-1141 / JCM 9156 / N-4) TaxID=649639 RepID=E6U0Q7_EVAC2|nr:hypothetical protein [Evansella cellulosilytica]ADU29105.1 hypothetical protein Bcell_0825 [Evansella cellulosilytica DSM 2522]